MKEGKTPAVLRQTPVQVLPSPNFMDRFVRDELFQNERGGFPTDAFDPQKTGVEPRLQQVNHVSIDRRELGMFCEEVAKVRAHRDDRGCALRPHVQDPKQLLPRGFRCGLQRRRCVGFRMLLICRDCLVETLAIGHEVCEQPFEELKPVAFRKAFVSR